jgi:hypothetical protein
VQSESGAVFAFVLNSVLRSVSSWQLLDLTNGAELLNDDDLLNDGLSVVRAVAKGLFFSVICMSGYILVPGPSDCGDGGKPSRKALYYMLLCVCL